MFDPGGEDAPIRPGDFMTVRTSVGQDFTLDPSIPISGYAQYVGVFCGSDWARLREEATQP